MISSQVEKECRCFSRGWHFPGASASARHRRESDLGMPNVESAGRDPYSHVAGLGSVSGTPFGLFGIEPQMIDQAPQFDRRRGQQQLTMFHHIGQRAKQLVALL